jgi:hypothetical protein
MISEIILKIGNACSVMVGNECFVINNGTVVGKFESISNANKTVRSFNA